MLRTFQNFISQENQSWGSLAKRDSKQSPQLQRLARNLNLASSKFRYDTFHRYQCNNKIVGATFP